MPKGRTTTLTVTLTPQQRRTLEAWQRTTTLPVGQVRRGRILLLLAEGRRLGDIARTVGISRRFVYKWVRRFQAQGLQGLRDLRMGEPLRRRGLAEAPLPPGRSPGQA